MYKGKAAKAKPKASSTEDLLGPFSDSDSYMMVAPAAKEPTIFAQIFEGQPPASSTPVAPMGAVANLFHGPPPASSTLIVAVGKVQVGGPTTVLKASQTTQAQSAQVQWEYDTVARAARQAEFQHNAAVALARVIAQDRKAAEDQANLEKKRAQEYREEQRQRDMLTAAAARPVPVERTQPVPVERTQSEEEDEKRRAKEAEGWAAAGWAAAEQRLEAEEDARKQRLQAEEITRKQRLQAEEVSRKQRLQVEEDARKQQLEERNKFILEKAAQMQKTRREPQGSTMRAAAELVAATALAADAHNRAPHQSSVAARVTAIRSTIQDLEQDNVDGQTRSYRFRPSGHRMDPQEQL
jgi:hypothetical protein